MIAMLLFVALSQQQYIKDEQFPILFEVLKGFRCFEGTQTCRASSRVMYNLFRSNDSKAVPCTLGDKDFGCSASGSLVSFQFYTNIPSGATLSTSIGSLTTLTNLALSNSRNLTGTVPRFCVFVCWSVAHFLNLHESELGLLKALIAIDFSGTGLTGAFPLSVFSTLTKLVSGDFFDCRFTSFSGTLPIGFENVLMKTWYVHSLVLYIVAFVLIRPFAP
jgi:hypothetical protein